MKKTKLILVEKVLKEIVLKDLVKSRGTEFKDKIKNLAIHFQKNQIFFNLNNTNQIIALTLIYFYFWKEDQNSNSQLTQIEQFCFWRLGKYLSDLQILKIMEKLTTLQKREVEISNLEAKIVSFF